MLLRWVLLVLGGGVIAVSFGIAAISPLVGAVVIVAALAYGSYKFVQHVQGKQENDAIGSVEFPKPSLSPTITAQEIKPLAIRRRLSVSHGAKARSCVGNCGSEGVDDRAPGNTPPYACDLAPRNDGLGGSTRSSAAL